MSIDYLKLKALRKIMIRFETRNRRGSVSKTFLIIFSYLIPGILVPFMIYKQSHLPGGFEFSSLSFLFFSVIFSFTVVSEFDNLVISKPETDIFSVLPVDIETIIQAKLSVIIRYILLISFPLIIPGSVFYYFINKSVLYSLLYYLSGVMCMLFIVFILLFLYAASLKNLKTGRLSAYILLFQVIMIFLLIFAYQFITLSFASPHQFPVNISFLSQKSFILNYLPSSWFAVTCTKMNYAFGFTAVLKTLLPVFILSMSYLSFRFYFSDNYLVIREKLEYSKMNFSPAGFNKKPFEFLNSLINKIYLRNKTELAAYTLLVSHFKRDRMTKLNIFPMAVIPVALTVFAIVTDQIIEPFSKSFFGRDSVFHIAILLSFLVAVYSANLGIKVSNHPESTWIFYSYPLQSRKMFLNGVRKFLVIYLLVPVVIFLLLIFSLVIPFYQVLAHVFYIFTAVSLFNSLVSAFGKDFPFSRENTLFNSIYRIASMLFPFLFGIVCVLIQIFAYKSILRSVITSIIIFLLTLLLNHFSFKRKNLDKQFFYLKT